MIPRSRSAAVTPSILAIFEEFGKLFDASCRFFQPTFAMELVVGGRASLQGGGGVALLQPLFHLCDARVRFREVVDEHERGQDEEFVFCDVADIVFHLAQSFVEVFSCVLQVFFLSLFADDASSRPVDDEGYGRTLRHWRVFGTGLCVLAVEKSFEVCERLAEGCFQVCVLLLQVFGFKRAIGCFVVLLSENGGFEPSQCAVELFPGTDDGAGGGGVRGGGGHHGGG